MQGATRLRPAGYGGQGASPLARILHRGPGLLRRQTGALLQQLDRVLVGRAHERHGAVARRAVDGDAGLLQPVAQRIDIIDLECEMTEVARLAVILAVPVVGELDQRRVAAGLLALGDEALIVGTGEEDQGVAVLVVDPPAHLLEAELVAIEIERGIEIADAQHGMKISHESLTFGAGIGPTGDRDLWWDHIIIWTRPV